MTSLRHASILIAALLSVPLVAGTAQASPTPANAAPTPGGRAIVVKGTGLVGFAMPSTRFYCRMHVEVGSSVDCYFSDVNWKPQPAEPRAGWGVRTRDYVPYLSVGEENPGMLSVAEWGEPPMFAAVLNFEGRPNPSTRWFDPKLDLAVPLNDHYKWKVAAPRYGSTITHGKFRCAIETKGVTCINTSTKHGFFASRESYRLF